MTLRPCGREGCRICAPRPVFEPPDESLRWRVWWRFGFGPILRVLRLLPIAEWRRETWAWRLDICAMDHIGTRSLSVEPPDESLAGALLGLAGVVLFGLAVVLLWVWAS